MFKFVIQQYNLMVCVDLSLFGYDPKVSFLLAGIAISLAVDRKGLWVWGGGLEQDFVVNSVSKKNSINLLRFARENLIDI